MISSVTRNNPSIEYSDVDGINMLFIMADASAIQELAKLPFVKTILPNTHIGGIIMDGARRYTGIDFAATAAVNIGKPNGLHDQASRINGDMDQNINSYSSSDSVIAIIDTGIDDSHPAFPGSAGQPGAKILYWHDFNRPGGGYTPCSTPCDDHGHGTHVAGIASGSNNSIYDGVAPGSALVILKGLQVGGIQGPYTTYPWTPGSHKDPFTLALEWVNDINNINTYGIDVLSLSVTREEGCYASTYDHYDNQLISQIISKGVNVVVGMANSGQSRCYFNPLAATPGVIAAGASIDPSKTWSQNPTNEFWHGNGHVSEAPSSNVMRASGWGIAAGSSKGPSADGKTLPTVVAPGVNIKSACNSGVSLQCDNGYIRMSGTSMATPFVAGVVAALNDAGVSSQSLRKAYIQDTALNVMKVDNKKENLAYGYGYIRPLEAYKQAIASPSTHDGERTRSGFDQVCQSYAYDYTFTVTDSSVPIAANVVISNYYNNNPYDAYLILSKGQWSKWAFTEKHPGGLPHENMVLSLTHENPEPGTYTLTYSPNNWPTVETCFFGNVSYR